MSLDTVEVVSAHNSVDKDSADMVLAATFVAAAQRIASSLELVRIRLEDTVTLAASLDKLAAAAAASAGPGSSVVENLAVA